mmetsp:Transcript_7784/g.7969  ORF Transcript_7784/g.7969 Transcript_7784/m.7969 type:complete len:195 (-) Transcript_7784:148-732(-)
MMEMSTAVKCPSVAYQLVGLKKIQQVLCEEEEMERFLSHEDAMLLKRVFADQYTLGPLSSLSLSASSAMTSAIDDGDPWVLKPQREGGGNNLYGKQLSRFLKIHKEDDVLAEYVLMQRIFPKPQRSIFVRNGQTSWEPSVSELGIFSVFLGDGQTDPVINEYAGYLVRTKGENVDEGGVASGYSVLNSVILSDS